MDPNAGAVFHPASDAAIAALPRKFYGEVEHKENKGTTCVVCMEMFEDGTTIAELPCGHFFCDGGCAGQWLKQSNSCPTCRAKLVSE